MSHRLKLAAAAAALLVTPSVAFGQTATGEIALNSTVAGSCGLGAPSQTVINLLDLSGPDGKLDPAKRSTSTQGSSVIADAWCNAPHSLVFEAKPMALQETRLYAQPSYMAREITYDAKLVGWNNSTLTRRPKTGDDGVSLELSGPYSASSPGLVLNVSRLETLTIGKVEDPSLMLEAGTYKGTVTITLSTLN